MTFSQLSKERLVNRYVRTIYRKFIDKNMNLIYYYMKYDNNYLHSYLLNKTKLINLYDKKEVSIITDKTVFNELIDDIIKKYNELIQNVFKYISENKNIITEYLNLNLNPSLNLDVLKRENLDVVNDIKYEHLKYYVILTKNL